jgi:hypothetical protein
MLLDKRSKKEMLAGELCPGMLLIGLESGVCVEETMLIISLVPSETADTISVTVLRVYPVRGCELRAETWKAGVMIAVSWDYVYSPTLEQAA